MIQFQSIRKKTQNSYHRNLNFCVATYPNDNLASMTLLQSDINYFLHFFEFFRIVLVSIGSISMLQKLNKQGQIDEVFFSERKRKMLTMKVFISYGVTYTHTQIQIQTLESAIKLKNFSYFSFSFRIRTN